MDNQELLNAISNIIDSKLEPIKNTLEEHGQILKALEERTKVTQAEVENIKYDVAEIKSDLSMLNDKSNLLETVSLNNWNEIVRMKSSSKKS